MNRQKIRFTKARTTAQGVQIQPASVEDFRRLVRFLKTAKEEYFTYSLEDEKPLRVVIRGVPGGVTEDEVSADLREQGFHPIQVTRMRSRRDKQAMPLVLIHVPREDKEILKMTRCCLLVVRVEEQKAPVEPSQCHRCQRFGHGQSRCTAAPRCVKCAGDHHSGDCTKPRESKAKCVNCSGEHPASYRGCPKHPSKAPAKKNTATPAAPKPPQQRQQQRQQQPQTARPAAKSYAGAAAQGKRTQQAVLTPPETEAEDTNLAEVLRDLSKLKDAISLIRQLGNIFNH